jgi:hypothetical protein
VPEIPINEGKGKEIDLQVDPKESLSKYLLFYLMCYFTVSITYGSSPLLLLR